MSVRDLSDMTFWSGLAFQRLGRKQDAAALFQRLYDRSVELEQFAPKIDYFATSLPAMLLFEEDLVRRNRIEALFLRAQALTGLGRTAESTPLLLEILRIEASHSGAADLRRQIKNAAESVTVR
jgi:hypothetical protein